MKIKLGGYSSSRAKEYVWVRLGDITEYDKFLTPKYAGMTIGNSFPQETEFSDLSFKYKSAGVEVSPGFIGANYVSLYWGDQDAQWIRDLSDSEKCEFERGAREALEYYEDFH